MKNYWKKGKRLPSDESTFETLISWIKSLLNSIQTWLRRRKKKRTLTLRSRLQTKELSVEKELIYTEEE